MALQYKKKQTEANEHDVPSDEFIKKMVDLKRTTENRPQVYNTESTE